MMKFTVRLSPLPDGTVDFFDLLRRIFNTESITRLVRLRQMLSVSAMLANLQKSSKVPTGNGDSCTCKVHSGRITPATESNKKYSRRWRKQNRRDDSEAFEDFDCAACLVRIV